MSLMTHDEYEKLPLEERQHFYWCSKCGQLVDKRELRDVIFHVIDHKPKPEIPRIKGKAIPKRPSEPLGSD
jgi:hypothetical protein